MDKWVEFAGFEHDDICQQFDGIDCALIHLYLSGIDWYFSELLRRVK